MRKREQNVPRLETPSEKMLHVRHNRRDVCLEATLQNDFCAMIEILNFILLKDREP